MAFCRKNLPPEAEPLRFLQNLAWERESKVLTLTQNFTIVALQMWAQSPSSIAGTKMIPFASYKAPQTQSRLPSPTK